MIVGGRLRGMSRAFRAARDYFLSYFTLGAILVIGGAMSLTGSPDIATACFFAHLFLSGLVIWPAALVASFAFARMLPRRRRRDERWRGWIAGILGIVLTWIGIALLSRYGDRPSGALRHLGGALGEILYAPLWIVLLSNSALLVAWLLPSRKC